MIPAELDRRGKRRVENWEKIKEIEGEGITRVVACADEEIRVGDVLTLIGLTGAVQDSIVAQLATRAIFREAGGTTLEIVSAVFSATKLCLAVAGDNDLQAFLDTVKRLKSLHCTYTRSNGSCGSISYLYDYKYDAKSNEFSVILKGTLIDHLKKNGWILDVKRFRRDLNSSAAMAAALYISQQKCSLFLTDRLIARLSIACASPRESRRALKSALHELKNAGYIGDFSINELHVTLTKTAKFNYSADMEMTTLEEVNLPDDYTLVP